MKHFFTLSLLLSISAPTIAVQPFYVDGQGEIQRYADDMCDDACTAEVKPTDIAIELLDVFPDDAVFHVDFIEQDGKILTLATVTVSADDSKLRVGDMIGTLGGVVYRIESIEPSENPAYLTVTLLPEQN